MDSTLAPGEQVVDGVRLIALAHTERAIAALDPDFADDPDDAVHEVRKRCKKIRAMARLVRPVVRRSAYREVNGLARDAARELGTFRDARALLATFERLIDDGDGDDDLAAARQLLLADQDDAAADLSAEHPAVERSRRLLVDLRGTLDRLVSSDDGWDAIAPGLVSTYDRGRQALSASIDDPSGASFHEWRKRAKDTRYHLGVIVPAAPDVLIPLEATFHLLTDSLGDAHDLHVLKLRLSGTAGTDDALEHIAARRSDAERRAVELGRQLYAESGRQFGRRLGRYWEADVRA
ncbi:MAG: CHAD domain-containing protein [Ilumatobacter sp.]|nr:CHAD domain-containing protein [Ilumatobacter sp.]